MKKQSIVQKHIQLVKHRASELLNILICEPRCEYSEMYGKAIGDFDFEKISSNQLIIYNRDEWFLDTKFVGSGSAHLAIPAEFVESETLDRTAFLEYYIGVCNKKDDDEFKSKLVQIASSLLQHHHTPHRKRAIGDLIRRMDRIHTNGEKTDYNRLKAIVENCFESTKFYKEP